MNARLAPLGALLYVLAAPAQGAAELSKAYERTLSGHTYMPSALLNQPFDTRHYAMSTGVGFSQFELDVTLPGFGDELSMAFFGFGADIQQPIYRGVGLRLDLAAFVLTGADQDAALLFGANGTWNVGGGLYWNFIDLHRFGLTFAVDLATGQGYTISPLAALQRAVETGNINAATLFSESTSFDVRPGLATAFTLHEAIGLYGELAYVHSNTEEQDNEETTGTFELGIGTSFNFSPYDVPVGLNFAYQYGTVVDGGDQSNSFIEFGLLYAPDVHFAIGPQAAIQLIGGDGFDATTYAGQIAMAYFQ